VTGRSGLARLLAALRGRFLEPPHPELAIEVRARSVGLVRLGRQGQRIGLAAAVEAALPEGTLAISLTEGNIRDAAPFVGAVRGLLERTGVPRGTAAALVLPDPVARVALAPAAELRPSRHADAEEMVRFRLRKSLPFDVREARVAQLALPAAPGREPVVMMAAILGAVLDGYEAALREAGVEPGLVELSGLSLLRAAGASADGADQLLLNWEEGYLSLLLTVGGQPALVRTLGPEASRRPEEALREVASTILYYRDKLGGNGFARALLRCSALPPAEAAALLTPALGVVPRVFEWSALPGADQACLGQNLAGAAACVLARVA
jgi:type IV pilus assembly protein PilM